MPDVIHTRKAFKRGYTLRFSPEGKLIITTGITTSDSAINRILNKHERWIKKHFYLISSARSKAIKFESGEEIMIYGKALTIKIFKDNSRRSIKVRQNIVEVRVAKSKFDDIKSYQPLFVKFIKTEAYKIFSQIVAKHASKMGLEHGQIRVKDLKSRWGSCSSRKNLNFNWRLLFAPPEVLEYVVIHELCHLKEMNHSQRFWTLVANEMPDYKVHDKWLSKNGQTLINYISPKT